jgi:hypothetical protein
MTLVKPNGAQLAEIFELIAADKVKLEVAKVGEPVYVVFCVGVDVGCGCWSLLLQVCLSGTWAPGGTVEC